MKPQLIELPAENGDLIRGYFHGPFNLNANEQNPALMIFCHGFPGQDMVSHKNLFPRLQNICTHLGIGSIRFDFRGCGASDGTPENFTIKSAKEDLITICQWAEKKEFTRYLYTAEGLGAVPALYALSDKAEAAAFFWPVFEPHDFAKRHLKAEDHKKFFGQDIYVEGKHGQLGIAFIQELYEMDLEEIMNQVRYPCLLQQGVKDEIVPIEYLDIACAYFRNRRIELTTYQDGTHGLTQENHRKNLMYHYEQFIQKYI